MELQYGFNLSSWMKTIIFSQVPKVCKYFQMIKTDTRKDLARCSAFFSNFLHPLEYPSNINSIKRIWSSFSWFKMFSSQKILEKNFATTYYSHMMIILWSFKPLWLLYANDILFELNFCHLEPILIILLTFILFWPHEILFGFNLSLLDPYSLHLIAHFQVSMCMT